MSAVTCVECDHCGHAAFNGAALVAGLVVGITPTSIRKQSPQQILDFALSPPAGADAVEPREGS